MAADDRQIAAKPPIELVDSWTEGDDFFCRVNRHPEHYDGTFGLQGRVVEDDWTVDGVVDQVLVGDRASLLGAWKTRFTETRAE